MREPHRGIQERLPRRPPELPRFLASAFRLLLHGFAYNLVNLFRLLELPPEWRSAPIETLRTRLFKVGARVRKGLDRRGANRERV